MMRERENLLVDRLLNNFYAFFVHTGVTLFMTWRLSSSAHYCKYFISLTLFA
jgi:hypothetical protein